MNRRALLIVSLAALFGLGAPLCLVACLEGGPAAPVAASAHDTEQSPPCHGGAPASPAEAPGSEHECDCASFPVLLTKGESTSFNGALHVAAPAPLLVAFRVPSSESSAPRLWERQRDLPPPDVLLLKSTLLV